MVNRLFLLLLIPAVSLALCPFLHSNNAEEPKTRSMLDEQQLRPSAGYDEAVRALDIQAVKEDLKKLMKESQPWWPADYGNYGPLFVRLAWHCSGSYRVTDGRGGCAGGRQRFDPERSWADNTNLDKARKLLLPLKNKYGLGLSWGDLFILAGTTAIESMGGPTLGFCAGRVDDEDGYWSQELGPTPEQEEYAPCPVNGTCKRPLGTTTIGLIYINPEGPMGQPLPEQSALEVRDVFARMAMNDSETVALIGGGHAFGKTHGACPKGAGPNPKQDPAHPWPGECGTGKALDAFTFGFEGPWTQDPTTWDNTYFTLLRDNDFEVVVGAGGHHQWMVSNATKNKPTAPAAFGKGRQDIMMLTTDYSLLHDPMGEYQKWVAAYADDQDKLNNAFAHAWYKLTTRDMGPVTRCIGPLVPPPQPFQYPLPPPPPAKDLPDFKAVAARVKETIHSAHKTLPPDEYHGAPYYGALFVRLAWQCASTFRTTDYQGGCNGARLRFSPEKDWPINVDLDKALALLAPIQSDFDNLSWADLIVLAGTVALEEASGRAFHFCPGRTDASDGLGSEYVVPMISPDGNVSSANVVSSIRDAVKIMGLSLREFVALTGGGHSLGTKHSTRSGFNGPWTADPTKVDASFFQNLLDNDWDPVTVKSTGKVQFSSREKSGLTMLATDMALKWDPELMAISQQFASDQALFLDTLVSAWTKVMNADRFDGPTHNLCANTAHPSHIELVQ